jgi:hypothetical protein
MTGYETNRKGFKDLWRSFFPPFGAGQIVQFYIEAFDEAGAKQTSPFYSYPVRGQPSSGVPPEILLIVLIVLILVVVVFKYRKRLF